jgi:hypothetical protein
LRAILLFSFIHYICDFAGGFSCGTRPTTVASLMPKLSQLVADGDLSTTVFVASLTPKLGQLVADGV